MIMATQYPPRFKITIQLDELVILDEAGTQDELRKRALLGLSPALKLFLAGMRSGTLAELAELVAEKEKEKENP